MGETAASNNIRSVAEFAEEMARGDGYPAGGAVAALVAALAASLAAAAADRSRAGWEEAGGARAQAQALRRRALALVDRDATAYAAARQALAKRLPESERGASGEEQPARDWRLRVVVEQAAEPPVELAGYAAAIAQLAAVIAERGAGDVRADAAVAAMLAAAAARGAAQLVMVNLIVGNQEPAARARRYAEAAAAAAASTEVS